MSLFSDRRVVIGVGALAAVGVGVAVALGLGRGDREDPPPPASKGGLEVEVGDNSARGQLDPTKPLRCFVDGKFVGIETLTRCAERNGVAAQALDVGLDETGEVAAATDQIQLAPLPDIEVADVTAPPSIQLPDVSETGPFGPGGSEASCMKHGPQGWSVVSENATVGTCVSLLFDGRCEEPGAAQYGRWGEQTVRLVVGKVEIAPDGKTFQTFKDRPDCPVPAI